MNAGSSDDPLEPGPAVPAGSLAERLAAEIADRRVVDWQAVARSAATDGELECLAELQVLQSVERFHSAAVSCSSHPPALDGELPGRWADLTLLEVIGRGAFGIVYRARDERLDRDVALKLMHVREGCEAATGLLHEAQKLARIRHPNVVTMYGANQLDGAVGIWMERIDGLTLEELLDVVGTFGAQEAALVAQQVCAGLSAVHRAGLLHRDVKAQNVMRERGGRVVLMDLGACVERLAADAAVPPAGTPLYLAPELFSGGQPSIATDLYGVGMLLFRMVTGGCAVEGRTIKELQDAHRSSRRVRLHEIRPDLPGPFIRTVERAIHPQPERRFASVGDLGAALRSFLANGWDLPIVPGPSRIR